MKCYECCDSGFRVNYDTMETRFCFCEKADEVIKICNLKNVDRDKILGLKTKEKQFSMITKEQKNRLL